MQAKHSFEPEGMTMILPVHGDPVNFYTRLIQANLRLSCGPVRPGIMTDVDGPCLFAMGGDCRGYLLNPDGLEAPESDLFLFLNSELQEGQGITISGHYSEEARTVVESKSHFLMFEGRLMSTERRRLIRSDGSEEILRVRSDISAGNVIPFPSRPGP